MYYYVWRMGGDFGSSCRPGMVEWHVVKNVHIKWNSDGMGNVKYVEFTILWLFYWEESHQNAKENYDDELKKMERCKYCIGYIKISEKREWTDCGRDKGLQRMDVTSEEKRPSMKLEKLKLKKMPPHASRRGFQPPPSPLLVSLHCSAGSLSRITHFIFF